MTKRAVSDGTPRRRLREMGEEVGRDFMHWCFEQPCRYCDFAFNEYARLKGAMLKDSAQ